MSSRVKTCFQTILVIVFSLTIFQPVYGQRITPDVFPQESNNDQSQERSDRLIFPEQIVPPNTSKRKKKPNEGTIEQLRADSAAMRVEFEEKISRLRSDSEVMSRQYEQRIQQLKKKIDAFRKEIQSLRTRMKSGSSENQRTSSNQSSQVSSKRSNKSSATSSQTDRPQASPEMKLNPNTANISDLASIPGLSRRIAERIEWYRREVRPFQSREDLRRVPGVDRKRFEEISPYFHEGSY